MQSVLQRQRNAAGHEDGLGKYNDNRRRVLRARERETEWLWDKMQNSRRCSSNVQMSSGDEQLNGDMLDGRE